MNEEKNYKEEAKRIAEEMRETEEHIQRLSKERDSEKRGGGFTGNLISFREALSDKSM